MLHILISKKSIQIGYFKCLSKLNEHSLRTTKNLFK